MMREDNKCKDKMLQGSKIQKNVLKHKHFQEITDILGRATLDSSLHMEWGLEQF